MRALYAPHVSSIGRRSRIELHTQYLDMFSVVVKLTPGFLFWLASTISTVLTPLSLPAYGRQLHSLKLIKIASSSNRQPFWKSKILFGDGIKEGERDQYGLGSSFHQYCLRKRLQRA